MPDANRYDDIINLPHHTSATRPRMSRQSRAAQFAPFAALTGYDDAIEEAARLTDERIELTEAEQLALSGQISRLKERLSECPTVEITFFRPDEKKAGGEYVRVSAIVSKIRDFEQALVLDDGREIAFSDILEIDGVQ